MTATLRTILVGYDGFERGEHVPALVGALAREHGARVRIVHVVPEPPHRAWPSARLSVAEVHAALVDSRLRRLHQLVGEDGLAGLDVSVHVATGAPHIELIRGAMAHEADLLIVTDEPMRRGGRGFGTITMKLLRDCPCPVLALRDHRGASHERILAAVDVAPEGAEGALPNQRIMQMAILLARRARGALFVFHAWSLWGEDLLRHRGGVSEQEVDEMALDRKHEKANRLDELLADPEVAELGCTVELHKGSAVHLLPKIVEERRIDVVVMGTVARTGLPGFVIGNTAERILNRLSCSVLTVKPPGFVSPVKP